MSNPGTPTFDQLRVFLTVVDVASDSEVARRPIGENVGYWGDPRFEPDGSTVSVIAWSNERGRSNGVRLSRSMTRPLLTELMLLSCESVYAATTECFGVICAVSLPS